MPRHPTRYGVSVGEPCNRRLLDPAKQGRYDERYVKVPRPYRASWSKAVMVARCAGAIEVLGTARLEWAESGRATLLLIGCPSCGWARSLPRQVKARLRRAMQS